MSSKKKHLKKHSILVKVFSILMTLALSIVLIIIALWGLVANEPNQLFAHIHLAITLVIFVIVGSLVASHIIRGILRPLLTLSDAVEKVGKGNFDQQIPISSNDELGTLATAFNQMTAELKKMIDAREQLLLDVSHELRTPITRAKLALEMMPESLERESIADDLKEMETMITEILESERLKNGNMAPNFAPVKIEILLHEVMENYHRENNRIILYPITSELAINIDKTLILMVLRNLIDNSLKYTSSQSKPIEISVIQRSDDIIIQIEDFGQGIPEDKLPFVFEPFYRADPSRSRKTGGYGLGLHLCKRIMDLHDAEIQLINKAGGSGLIATLIFSD